MTEVVVLDGARTPIGSFGGSLREVNAPTLLEHAFRAALAQTKIDPTEIDETIVGQVFQGSDAPDIARYGSLRVGIPKEVPGIALGHPVGMSGNRLLLTMACELKYRHAEYGVISLCAGGGQGIAMVVQNIA